MESSYDKLIDEVEQFPILFDVENPAYRKNNVRLEIWNGIAKRLGTTAKACQTKWKNIRYQYYKDRREAKLPSGSGTSAKKRKCTRDLSFLEKYAIDKESTSSNFEEDNSHMESMDIFNESDNIQEEIIETSNSVDFIKTSASTPKPQKKKSQNDLIKNLDNLIKEVEESSSGGLDTIDMFLLSFGDALRSMEIKEQMRVKFEIMKIFKDAEYKDPK